MRPWSPIPIEDCGEPLQALPPALLRMEPHPYMALGAPYGASGNPFQLRLGSFSASWMLSSSWSSTIPACA